MNSNDSTWTLSKVALYALYAAAALFVVAWHWRHLIDSLPFLVVLACPLMHLFMHHGHGHHGAGRDASGEPRR